MDRKLLLFARVMERELEANRAKGDWKALNTETALRELAIHVVKLSRAVESGNQARILEHAADVANSALFVANSTKALEQTNALIVTDYEEYDT